MITEVKFTGEKLNHRSLSDTCLFLLEQQKITNQIQLKDLLEQQGFEHINQSLVSKLLTSLGAAKVDNATGEKIYTLVNTLPSYSINQPLKHQILSISHNSLYVIVKTEEGFAQPVEQFFKHNCQDFILACISGFNSLLVLPAKNTSSKKCEQQIRRYLKIMSNIQS